MNLYRADQLFYMGVLHNFQPEDSFQRIEKNEIVGECDSTTHIYVKGRVVPVPLPEPALHYLTLIGTGSDAPCAGVSPIVELSASMGAGPAVTDTVDTVPMPSVMVEWTLYFTGAPSGRYGMKVLTLNDGGGLNTTTYGILGVPIDVVVVPTLVGSDIELQVTNNTTYALDIAIVRMSF